MWLPRAILVACLCYQFSSAIVVSQGPSDVKKMNVHDLKMFASSKENDYDAESKSLCQAQDEAVATCEKKSEALNTELQASTADLLKLKSDAEKANEFAKSEETLTISLQGKVRSLSQEVANCKQANSEELKRAKAMLSATTSELNSLQAKFAVSEKALKGKGREELNEELEAAKLSANVKEDQDDIAQYKTTLAAQAARKKDEDRTLKLEHEALQLMRERLAESNLEAKNLNASLQEKAKELVRVNGLLKEASKPSVIANATQLKVQPVAAVGVDAARGKALADREAAVAAKEAKLAAQEKAEKATKEAKLATQEKAEKAEKATKEKEGSDGSPEQQAKWKKEMEVWLASRDKQVNTLLATKDKELAELRASKDQDAVQLLSKERDAWKFKVDRLKKEVDAKDKDMASFKAEVASMMKKQKDDSSSSSSECAWYNPMCKSKK